MPQEARLLTQHLLLLQSQSEQQNKYMNILIPLATMQEVI